MPPSYQILGQTINQADINDMVDGAVAAGTAYAALQGLSSLATGDARPEDAARMMVGGILAGAMASQYSSQLKSGLEQTLTAIDKVL